MADAQINIFEVANNELGSRSVGAGFGILQFFNFYVPSSISFNNVAFLFNGVVGTASRGITFRMGLYSLNAGSFSLANSASRAMTLSSTNGLSWITMVTSATQNITPGLWWIAFHSTRTNGAAGAEYGLVEKKALAPFSQGGNVGVFLRGYDTSAYTAMPVSVNTTRLSKEGLGTLANSTIFPYILISA